MESPKLNPSLDQFVNTLESEFQNIAPDRLIALKQLGDYILEESSKEGSVQLIFICTHNSRRSHFSQAWAATAAYFYGLDDIVTYSGGTGFTAFNPRAVEVILQQSWYVHMQMKPVLWSRVLQPGLPSLMTIQRHLMAPARNQRNMMKDAGRSPGKFSTPWTMLNPTCNR